MHRLATLGLALLAAASTLPAGPALAQSAPLRASAPVTEAALSVLPEGVRPEDICRSDVGALPHLGQLWPAAILAALPLHDRRATGLRGLFAQAAPAPAPDAADFMVMEIAAAGPDDATQIWLRLRPSDRLRGGEAHDVWLHYATDNAVLGAVREVVARLQPAG